MNAFNNFYLEHCTLKNMREDIKKYYIENMKYGFYKYYDKDKNINCSNNIIFN